MKKVPWHRVMLTFIFVAIPAALTGCGGSGGGNSSNSPPTSTFTVGGKITGLGTATGLVLTNGSDTLEVPANTSNFTMPTSVASGQLYDVAVKINPTAMDCTIINGAGTVNGANVTSINVSCEAGAESLVYSFAGGTTDGASPLSNLIQAKDGDFYGVTYEGGANGDGVVFKVTPGGAESVLYSFAGGTADGANPGGSLLQAGDGNFYGETLGGGMDGEGTVFEITPGGAESVLYSFTGGATDGFGPEGGLTQGSDGNLYGVTEGGGAYDNGVVFMITPSGAESVLYSFKGGTTDGENPVGSLIQGSDGNLYGLTGVVLSSSGNNYGVVFKVTPSGAETVLHFFADATTDGAGPAGGLLQASDGNFYGVTFYDGATGNGAIFRITPGGSESILYSFSGGTTDGANPNEGLIQGSDGSLYGVTYGGGASGHGSVFAFD